jgi:flavin-dependent dehydrogenase
MTADCVVVGAGPAGSVTALLLARAGFDVVILDRQPFPRAKPCGDCLSPQANLLLAELGLLTTIRHQQPACLDGWRIIAPSGNSFEARFSDCASDPRVHHGFACAREQFDSLLLDAARLAGARVHTGVRVDGVLQSNGHVTGVSARSSTEDLQEVRAKLTVGADGLRSTLRKNLGLAGRAPRLRKVALSGHAAGVMDLQKLGELHLGDGICAGLAPITADGSRCNVTLVVDADRFGRELAGKPASGFRRWLAAFPRLRGRVQQLELLSDLHAAGPFDRPTVGVVKPGAALVGDAAGYFDPFTGQGIFQAMAGAQLLAREASRALHAGVPHLALFRYARGLRRLTAGTRFVQGLIDQVCARPPRAERCVAALAMAPRAARHLIAVTGDLRPPVSLLSPATLLSFLAGFSIWSRSS